MILICRNDIRARECVAELPDTVLDTYTIAFEDNFGTLGFCAGTESTEVLSSIIKPKSFMWSNGISEPMEFSGDYKRVISRRASGVWIVFHEVNENFYNELAAYRTNNIQMLKAKLNKKSIDITSGLLWSVVNKNPGLICLGDLCAVNNTCKFISVWSRSDAGIYFHLYAPPQFISKDLDIKFVDELPCE